MSQDVDSLLSEAFQESPIQGALLGVLLDGGRIVSTGEVSEGLLNLVPDVVNFDQKERDDKAYLQNLSAKDLVFVEEQSIDQLWELAQWTGAQIVLLAKQKFETELADYVIQESDLRSALLGLGAKWTQLKTQAEEYCLDGDRTEKALFLDRDGVVIEDMNYVRNPSDVKLKSGIADLLTKARALGFRLIVVTNQSGMGRGMIGWDQYDSVTITMQQQLAKEGIFLDRIVKAPFFTGSSIAKGLVRKSLRKPRPGMIHSVVNEFRIDLSKSILVGDSATDLMSGALAGVTSLCLLRSGKFEEQLRLWEEWSLLSRAVQSSVFKKIKSLDEVL